MKITRLSAVVAALALTACHHAVIETGLPPGTTMIEQPWAPSFVYGLVPPATVETATRCPQGVSRVETQRSFVNQLVGMVTFGLFTPMTIKVTCAAGGRTEVPRDAKSVNVAASASLEQALIQAVGLSLESGEPVYLKY